MKLKVKETEILGSICQYLQVKHYFFWRSNNIPVFDTNRKAFRAMPKWCVKGVPDIFVLTTTKTIGLEVKSKTGIVSPDQKLFEAFWNSRLANREYHVVRSVEEVQEIGL